MCNLNAAKSKGENVTVLSRNLYKHVKFRAARGKDDNHMKELYMLLFTVYFLLNFYFSESPSTKLI